MYKVEKTGKEGGNSSQENMNSKDFNNFLKENNIPRFEKYSFEVELEKRKKQIGNKKKVVDANANLGGGFFGGGVKAAHEHGNEEQYEIIKKFMEYNQ